MTKATPLQHGYCFWYMRRGKNVNNSSNNSNNAANKSSTSETSSNGGAADPANSDNNSNNNNDSSTDTTTSNAAAKTTTPTTTTAPNPYENSIKTVATVKTVEEFWTTYDHLVRPNDLPTTTDYHFFREGIKPTWEDPGNARGGKWIVRLRKGLASRYWEETLLALIGGQFQGIPDGEVCGAVVSIRYGEDIVSVWNKTADDREITERLRDAIKKILQLPSNVHMEYKPHQTSLQDKSSFRNTTVWKPKIDRSRSSGVGNGGLGDRDSGDNVRGGGLSLSLGGRDDPSSSRGGPRRSGSWGEPRDKHSWR
eukprot:CAMPEP_0178965318 /NCGR_PEP_ID=MMETSP0789-20121207/16213_1 /TAXON_ID=3005 /ORGANISM="Rhizosolenia setigera, Strain CCMP 1694" /LENGTH=309 /DNA_ID=CAMNT_0020650285 /DNA_START=58 /DNA_END=987 /DNA_ORIENTATION=-